MNTIIEKTKAPPKKNLFFASEFWFNYRRSLTAVLGSLIVAFVVLTAVLGPMIAPQNPYIIANLSLEDAYKPPMWIDGGDSRFILGTDQQGRDMFSAIIYGSRISLFIGLTGVLMASAFGISMGLLSGYFGGRIDSLIMRLADIQLSFPSLLIALFLMTSIGQGVINILIALLLVGWVRYARTVRGATLTVKQAEYIEATRVIGFSNSRILIKHVLPNILTSIIVLSTIQVGQFILTEATLSFLGMGVPVTEPSLGLLCSNGFSVLFSGLWWVSIFPGLYIMLIVFGINLLGDFLRDEFNPKLK